MWFVTLAACHWMPSETGSSGMVGTLSDGSGAPIEGQTVETLEAQARTDATGHFAVTYKRPNTEIHFVRGMVFYQRRWLVGDPTVVDIRLPATRSAELACGELACDITLTWNFSDGFVGRLAGRCSPGGGLALGQIPVGTPVLTCRADLGSPEEVNRIEDRGDRLVVIPPASTLVVRIAAAGAAPVQCAVAVDGKPAPIAPDGTFTAQGRGLLSVAAVCDGRPARPAVVDAAAGEIALAWSGEGPSLQVKGAVGELEIQCRSAEGAWAASWVAGSDGVFRLPPLLAGSCEFVLAPPEERSTVWEADGSALRPGVLTLLEVLPGAFKGWLDLKEPLLRGAVPLSR